VPAVVRPALLVPPLMSIDVNLLCILPTATFRRAVRKILRCSDDLNQLETAALRNWLSATVPPTPRRGRRAAPADSVYISAAALFREFVSADGAPAETVCNKDTLDSEGESTVDEESNGSSAADEAAAPPGTRPSTINNAGDDNAGRSIEPKQFSATHPAVNGKDLDSIYSCFEYFGCLPRVQPAIFAHKAQRQRRRPAAASRSRSRRKRNQAVEEDENDWCSKAFPEHKDLTSGVFYAVWPHVVTLGFRVMFKPESVSDALSVILERFPKLPEVVFYDVGCKLDRNVLRRVRTIFRQHGVKVVLDRVHAKGHTCSPVFFPNESLGKTTGVTTHAADVQHSISVKFRTHLAYMDPETFMAHRIVQLALMNLEFAYKIAYPIAKKENEDADMGAFIHSDLATGCRRSGHCSCPAAKKRWMLSEGIVSE